MNNLILIRHGQSHWNKERRFTGWADIDLTEQGKKEAKHAGELIKELNIKFDAFFTSNLKRASNIIEQITHSQVQKINDILRYPPLSAIAPIKGDNNATTIAVIEIPRDHNTVPYSILSPGTIELAKYVP